MKKLILCATFLFISFFAFAQGSNKAENFYNYKKENLQFRFKDFPKYDENVSLDEIKANQGYFMQNQMMVFQGDPRSNILFKLHVDQENVFLDEVDVIDSAEIVRKQHVVKFEYKKWRGDEYQIKKYNDKIFIFDYQASWNDRWAYDFPFVKVCDLNQLMSCDEALSITTKNLMNFTGEYVFDSSYIVKNSGNKNLEESLKLKTISIGYDEENKSLVTNVSSYRYNKFGKKASHYIFSETKTPFFWIFAEGGAGSSESILMFYDDGIALYEKIYKNNSSCDENDTGGDVEFYEYAAFYKR